MTSPPIADDAALFDRLSTVRADIESQLSRRIVGQSAVVEAMLVALFSRGHCLFIGVPGLAKTLLVTSLAQALGLRSGRIQFTPDLMPADITGTEVLEEDRATGRRELRFVPGPIFTHLLLADEVNRTPPRTQAALLQAMQEGQVTAGGRTHPLEAPFLVFATQNPIEQEGTYPLPEAQLDRFMLSINIGYPTRAEEREIVMATTQATRKEIQPVLQGRDVLWIQQLVRQVPVSQHMVDYAVDLVRATRPKEPPSPDFVKRWLAWGAGPRAAQNIVLTAKARAILHGRFAVTAEDIRAVTFPVLRHRIFTNFNADAEGVDVDQIIEKILQTVPEPAYGEPVAVRAAKVPPPSSDAHGAKPVPPPAAPPLRPSPPPGPYGSKK